VTGSVGAIGDKTATTLTSFQPGGTRNKPHKQGSESDHRRRPTVPTSPGRMTELRVQFGLGHDTTRIVSADLHSPSSTNASDLVVTTDQSQDLPVAQTGLREFSDQPENQKAKVKVTTFDIAPPSEGASVQKSLPNEGEHQSVSDWQKNCQSLEGGQGCHLNLSDWKPETVEPQHNFPDTENGNRIIVDGPENRVVFTDGLKNSQTPPHFLENCPSSTDDPEDRTVRVESQGNRQNSVDKVGDFTRAVGPENRDHSDSERHLSISEGREVTDALATASTRGDRTTLARDNDDDTVPRGAASYSDVIPHADVALPPLTSSVVMATADATESANSRSTVSGNHSMQSFESVAHRVLN